MSSTASAGRGWRDHGTLLRRVSWGTIQLFVASIPLDVWPLGGVGSVSAIFGVAAAAFGILAVLERKTLRQLRAPHILLLCFIGWSALTMLWTWDQDATIQRAITNVQCFLMIYILWQMALDEREVRSLAAAYLVGLSIVACLTLWNYRTGEAWVTEKRYAASGYDPNELAVALAVGIPLAWLVVSRSASLGRLLAGCYVLLAFIAIFLSGSRGGLIATAVAVSVWVLAFRHATRKGKLAGILGVLLLIGISANVVPEESWSRLLTIQEQVGGGSLGQRIPIWKAAVSLIPKHGLVGIGAGAFPVAAEQLAGDKTVAHNTLVSVTAESGLVGIALFYVPWLWLCRKVRRQPEDARWVAFVVALTWAVGSMSLTLEYRKTTWLVIAFLCELAYPMAVASKRHRPTAVRRRTVSPGHLVGPQDSPHA